MRKLSERDALQAIQQRLASFSPAGKKLAEYILEHPDESSFLNVASIAETVGVSHASVVRFAQSLGYEGYPELQRALQARLTEKLTTVQRVAGLSPVEGGDFWQAAMGVDLDNLAASIGDLDRAACNEAATWLHEARTVYVLGLRSTASLASFAAFGLQAIRSGPEVVLLSATEFYEQASSATSDDVVLGFSFPRYFRTTVDIMRHLRDKGLRCIAVTDSLASPLAQAAQLTLTCRVSMQSFVESFVAPLSLVNALLTAVALRNKEAVLQKLGHLEDTWLAQGVYFDTERKPLL